MKTTLKAILPVVLFASTMALFAQTPAPTGKTVFITGPGNYCDMYEQFLVPAKVKVVKSTAKTNSKKWIEQGQVIPKFDEIKQYNAVIVTPLANLLPGNKEDIVKYVENGGTVIFLYSSLLGTSDRAKDVGFGICGFSKIETVKPKLHKLKYTDRMGTKRELEMKGGYTFYASDLKTAEALVVNSDLPGKAIATISKHGKGFFIHFGAEDKSIILDIFKVVGLTK